jgi:hypothetical protein
MNNNARQELLRVLNELASRFPEVRIGQLVANLSYAAKGPTESAVWDVEDEELLAAAKDHLSGRGKNKSSVA